MLMQKLATFLWGRLNRMAFLFWCGFDFDGNLFSIVGALYLTPPKDFHPSIHTIHPLIAPRCYIHPQMVYSLNASWQGAVSQKILNTGLYFSSEVVSIAYPDIPAQNKTERKKVEASFAVGSCGLVLCDININRRESLCSWIRISTWLDTLVNFVVTSWQVLVCCT